MFPRIKLEMNSHLLRKVTSSVTQIRPLLLHIGENNYTLEQKVLKYIVASEKNIIRG